MLNLRSFLIFQISIFCLGARVKVNATSKSLPLIDLSKQKSDNSSLELVHVLLRHGPRTPVATYPNDPYINHTFHPYGWGELTNESKKELFMIGKKLAKRYRNLLRPYYKPDLLYAHSSASSRTLMSMGIVLAAMFPPQNTPMQWNSKLNWQPIPVFSDPKEQDHWLGLTAKCPRYDQALQEVLHMEEVQQELRDHKELLEELSEITGLNVTHSEMSDTYIGLTAEQHYGVELPNWAKNYFPQRMQHLAEQSYILKSYTKEMQRIKGGFFLQKLLKQMEEKANEALKPPERKLFLYCGHDWTIVNVLRALNVWQKQMPRFSALILFELHKNLDTDTYYLELYFQNDPKLEPEPLIIPGCDFQCPLEKLIQLTHDVLPQESFEEMCRLK